VIPQNIAAEASAMSDWLEEHGYGKTLLRQGRVLHATLFMTDYPTSALDDVTETFQKIASEECAMVHLHTPRERVLSQTKSNWVFLDLEPTKPLGDLAMKFADGLAPLRARELLTPPAWVVQYPEKMIMASFAKYGSPNVGENFVPHMTLLTALPPEKCTEAIAMPPSRAPVEARLMEVALGRADELGQITEVLAVATLGSAQPSMILPNLYLGSKFHASNIAVLKQVGITHICSCIGGGVRGVDPSIKIELFPMSDTGTSELEDTFPEAFEFLSKVTSERGKKVLVHCSMGVNRSPTMVVGFLMATQQWSLKKAHAYVAERRPQICLHDLYVRQLRAYDEKLFGQSSTEEGELMTTSRAMVRAVEAEAKQE